MKCKQDNSLWQKINKLFCKKPPEKEITYFKRYIEEYEITEQIAVGKVVAEIKVASSDPVYQEILGEAQILHNKPHSINSFNSSDYPEEIRTYNYNIGFIHKQIMIGGYSSHETYQHFLDMKERLIQFDLLNCELDKEYKEKVYPTEEAKQKYHFWIKDCFTSKVFIINDDYFNPDKIISCKIHTYDKNYSIPIKVKAFKVKESTHETWIR